jgi:hypothetical protein
MYPLLSLVQMYYGDNIFLYDHVLVWYMQIADRAMCVAPRARGTQMWHSVRGPLARGLQVTHYSFPPLRRSGVLSLPPFISPYKFIPMNTTSWPQCNFFLRFILGLLSQSYNSAKHTSKFAGSVLISFSSWLTCVVLNRRAWLVCFMCISE